MLELIHNRVVIDPDLMTIPQFKIIWDRDETTTKEEAYAYISFIFNYYNPRSPFFNYIESERKKQIVNQIFPEHMKDVELFNDKAFVQASEIYNKMLGLSPMRNVLEVCKMALHEISATLKDAQTDVTVKLNQMSKLTKAFEEYKRAEKLISEDELNSKIKGARTVRARER